MKNNKKFIHGWAPDLPDIRDFKYKVPKYLAKKVPTKVDLRSKCPPVLDQGELGSCTANAIANAHLFNQKKQKAKNLFLPSRLFIYYNERKLENTIRVDSGAQIRNGFKTISHQGACPEDLWVYDISKFTKKPPVKLYIEALNHQVVEYMRITPTLANLKGCLADGYPFVFGFMVYESFESDKVAKTGIVPMPSKERALGGHAVLCVGYSNTKKQFIVQNSWGSDWADKGYFYLPFDYLTNSNLSDDFWTVRLVEV